MIKKIFNFVYADSIRKILPLPAYQKKKETMVQKKPLANCFLTAPENLKRVREEDRDMRGKTKIDTRDERAVKRLLEKEARETRWKKNDQKWRVKLSKKFWP